MKKIGFVIIIFLSLSVGLSAQNVDDVLRYSQSFYGGTSRFMSMGGAFTAIGGDISTLSQNPAGLGLFRSSELTVSPQLMHINTDASWSYGNANDYIYKFNLSQAGIVSNLVKKESGLISLNFGYSFNKSNNLNQSIRIQGLNTHSSMADSWANSSEGVYFSDLVDAPGIAFDAWVIDTLRNAGGSAYGTAFSNYGDDPSSVYGQTVRRLISYDGYTGEHAVSIGGNYNNKVYFGATLGINKIKFSSHYEHLERANSNLTSGLENFVFTDHFENTGTGYSLKIGAIFKPIEILRIGVAFHSPTWYTINEYFYESISSNLVNEVLEVEPQRYQYGLSTPFRALAGAAVQVGKMGLISADYEFVDYRTARFYETGDGFDYSEKNLEIKNTLQSAHNIKLGGELRMNKLYLRGGYGYYGRVFQSGEDNQDLNYNSLSAGVGFREQRVSIDFGFTTTYWDQSYILYPLDSEFPAAASLNTNKNMFTLTLGYKFGYQ
jgi:hypothetical protein